mmetsp:Transcript_27879/g.64988  ORF Transcript_27879/g.64988 Transcript_27879/m.64988 type:complete len:259 (+) Transcript_27879:592-1368(+)
MSCSFFFFAMRSSRSRIRVCLSLIFFHFSSTNFCISAVSSSKSSFWPTERSLCASSQWPSLRCALPRILKALPLSGLMAIAAVQSEMHALGLLSFSKSSARFAYIMAVALPILMASVYFFSASSRLPSSMASTAACLAAPWASNCSSVSSSSPGGAGSGYGSASSGSLSGSSSSGNSGSSGSSSSSSSGSGAFASAFFGSALGSACGASCGFGAAFVGAGGTLAPQLKRNSLKKVSSGPYTRVGSALSFSTAASRAFS